MIRTLAENTKNNIAIICICFGLLAAVVVLTSWLYGYWSNGLYGTRFQIDSCWQGISACGMGLVGLFKWLVDSTKNSPAGQYPRPPMWTRNQERGEITDVRRPECEIRK